MEGDEQQMSEWRSLERLEISLGDEKGRGRAANVGWEE